MATYPYKNITIEYNYLNLPNKITWSASKYIELVYDASGNKWRKIVTDGSTKTVYDYFGGIEYKNGNFDALYHAEGRVTKTNTNAYRYEYTIKDHLGNGRVYFTDINSDNNIDDSDILQEQNYYAFGAAFDIGPWYGNTATKSKYQYNGKELNDDFGLNLSDYGARWYDANIGRWLSLDPLAEKSRRYSPFVYGNDNPVRFIDPDGMESQAAFGSLQAERNSKKSDDLMSASAYGGGNTVNAERETGGPGDPKPSKTSLVLNGVKNIAFGAIGTVGAVLAAPETGGLSSIAIPLTVGEIGIGMAQVLDAFSNNNASEDDLIHKSSSLPGLVAYRYNSKNANYIDAAGQFLPGVFSGGNFGGGITSTRDLFLKPTLAAKVFNGLSAADAVMDISGLVNATYSKVTEPKLQEVTKKMSKHEVEAVKNFITNLKGN